MRGGNGSVYNGTLQGEEHILHAEAEQSEQKIESALYIYVLLLPADGEKQSSKKAREKENEKRKLYKKA